MILQLHVFNDSFCVLQGNIALEKAKRRKPFDWFPDEGWEDCIRLNEAFPDKFGSLLEDIERNQKYWKEVGRIISWMILFSCIHVNLANFTNFIDCTQTYTNSVKINLI